MGRRQGGPNIPDQHNHTVTVEMAGFSMFSSPDIVVAGTAAFGTITTAFPARQIQFGLKLLF